MAKAASKKTTYDVTKANGKTVQVEADSVESESGRVRFYVGDEQVAEFAGVQDWHPTSSSD